MAIEGKSGRIYNIATVQGVMDRVRDFTKRTAQLEKNGKTDVVENRWRGFDRLVAGLDRDSDSPTLALAAYTLFGEHDEHLDNAALTLLGAPSVVTHILDPKNELFDATVSTYDGYLPFSWELSRLDTQSVRAYNMLRSVENLLRLGRTLVEARDPRFEEVASVLIRTYDAGYLKILREMSEDPDMEGTMVREYFGTRKR